MSQIPISNNPTPPKRGDRVMAKDIADLWQSVKRLAARQEKTPSVVFPNPKLAPLTVTLRRIPGDPETYEVFAQFGHVVPRHNESGAAGTPIAIASLPTEDTPLVVVVNTKLWVRVTVNASGKATAATWQSNTTWPTDTPPELIGGDDQTGASGYRYVRIAEIIANPDSTTTPAQLQCDQLHTGHVDHFQPTLTENLTTSPSTGEARVMKEWNTSSGRWDFRYLTDGAGITITENASSIEVKVDSGYDFAALSSHPWKATANGDEFVNIAEGRMMFPIAKGTAAPDMAPIVYNSIYFAGDAIEVTSATGWIYAYGTPITPGGQMVGAASNIVGGSYDLVVYSRESDSVGIIFSSDDPSTFSPSDNYVYYPICQVALAAGIASVTAQHLTHNPTHDLVWVDVLA